MSVLVDLVRQTSATTGTGTLTLGAADTGFRTLATAGLPDGTIVSYSLLDTTNLNRETGRGVIGGSGTTLTRSFLRSTTGSILNLTGPTLVSISPNADDFPFIPEPVSGGWLGGKSSQSSNNGFFSTGSAAFHPIIIPSRRTIDRLACMVWNAANAGAAAKLALYRPGSDGFPLTKVAENAATLDATTAGAKIGTLASNPTVDAGLYWAGFTSNSNTGTYLSESDLNRAITELGIATSLPASNDFSIMRVEHAVTWAGSGEIFPATLSALSILYNSYAATPSMFARCA
jgi:hypothetical protein